MERPVHRLSVSCAQPGAVFRVTDGRSAPVGNGMYRLELDLPPGLYTVSALLGACTVAKNVLLDRPKSVEIEVSTSSFGEMAFGLMPRIRAQLPASCWSPDAMTMVAVRGPFAKSPSKKNQITIDVDGAIVEPAAAEAISDAADQIWQWQVFRIEKTVGEPDIITAVRAVDGVKNSHVVPRFGNWMVWATYPAPREVASDDVALPSPHYVRLRLTQHGITPDMALQSLSDQVFTALANRSTLPMSPPVLDLLFAESADPLLALAAAHLASMKLGRYGLQQRLPQDQAGSARKGSTDTSALAHEGEPVPPAELQRRVMDWLQRHGAHEIGHCPDMVAVQYLYRMCEEIDLVKPPVLLRSLDALITAENMASESGEKCHLDESVWLTRFQVSDSFAYLQWETDTKKGEEKRLEVLKQSFEISKALEQSLQELRQARVERERVQASHRAAAATSDTHREDAAPAVAQATRSPRRFAGTFFQRAEQSAAVGRFEAADFLAKATGSSAMRRWASNEFETYLKLNAKALRLPSSAVDSLTRRFAKTRAKMKV